MFVLREQQVRDQGWSKSLRGFPGMSESVIEKTLIAESTTFPQKSVAPNAYRHMKQGYKGKIAPHHCNFTDKPNEHR